MSITQEMTLMKIGFINLRVNCLIGTFPNEKLHPQEIFITLSVSLPQPILIDDLTETIDYTVLAQVCRECATARHHALLEMLDADILDVLFTRFSIASSRIRIEKPSALVDAEYAFIECERRGDP